VKGAVTRSRFSNAITGDQSVGCEAARDVKLRRGRCCCIRCRYPGDGVRARHLGSRGLPRRHAGLQLRTAGPLRLRPHGGSYARRRGLPVGRLLRQRRLRQRLFQVVRGRTGTALQGSRLGASAHELAQQQRRTKGQQVQSLRLFFSFIRFVIIIIMSRVDAARHCRSKHRHAHNSHAPRQHLSWMTSDFRTNFTASLSRLRSSRIEMNEPEPRFSPIHRHTSHTRTHKQWGTDVVYHHREINPLFIDHHSSTASMTRNYDVSRYSIQLLHHLVRAATSPCED